MDERYAQREWWLGHRDLPFSTLVRVVQTYCHPEVGDEAYEELVRQARAATPGSQMAVFKDELGRALTGEPVPGGALTFVSGYDGETEDSLLRRLWRDFYPSEPLPVRVS